MKKNWKRAVRILLCSFVLCFAAAAFAPVGSLFGSGNVIIAQAASKPKLSRKKATVTKGKTLTLTLKNAKKGKVKWKVSDKKIASISANGSKVTITGKKAGTVKVNATYKKKKYTCKVTVKNPSPKLSEKKKTIKVGETFTLKLKNGGSGAKWKTTNKKVATIKKVSATKYKITGKKAGTAKIKVTYKKKTYTCTVTVKKKSTSSTETEAAKTETEATGKETEATKTETEATGKETEAAKTETEAADKETESAKTETEAADKETESTKTETEAADKETEATETETEASSTEPEVTIAMNPSSVTLDSGESVQITLEGAPEDAEIEWECSYDNMELMCIDWKTSGNTCTVTGYWDNGEGYYITAAYNDKTYRTCIEVNAIIEKPTFDAITIQNGETCTLDLGAYASYVTSYWMGYETIRVTEADGTYQITGREEGSESAMFLIGGHECYIRVTVTEN